MPAVLKMSFRPMGMPCSGPLQSPAAISASACRGIGHCLLFQHQKMAVQAAVQPFDARKKGLGQLNRR